MASWGPKLYQDDVAEDVRDYYKDQIKLGKENEEVTKELIEINQDIISDSDDAPIFWFALADTQWEYGKLHPLVKQKALMYLERGDDLERWIRNCKNQKEIKAREEVLEELKVKLKSDMPVEKKVSKQKLFKCDWKTGDVYAYKLESDYAVEKGLLNRCVLIHKIDEDIWHPGHIVPIVRIKITQHNKLPNSKDEFNNLEYVQTWQKKIDGTFFPEFLITMITTSKTMLPKKLEFIANYQNVLLPENEYIEKDKLSIISCHWKVFETTIIGKYFKFK